MHGALYPTLAPGFVSTSLATTKAPPLRMGTGSLNGGSDDVLCFQISGSGTWPLRGIIGGGRGATSEVYCF
jgi:hypothetical protein